MSLYLGRVPNLGGPNLARAVFRRVYDADKLQKSVSTVGMIHCWRALMKLLRYPSNNLPLSQLLYQLYKITVRLGGI